LAAGSTRRADAIDDVLDDAEFSVVFRRATLFRRL
jgi:hypothetical protein